MLHTNSTATHFGVFGDSIGKGIVLPSDSKRYRTLKLEIHALLGLNKQQFIIDNYSMMGSTISKGLSIVERNLAKISQYKYVFLEFGGNDCDYYWEQISEQPTCNHECKTPIEQFHQKYEKMIQLIRSHGSIPIMLTLPPLSQERYFTWFSKHLNKENIQRWLNGDIHLIYRWQELYNSQVIYLANKLSVPLIDIRAAFLMQPRYEQLICEDGIHPNKSGYELIYQTISNQFKKIFI